MTLFAGDFAEVVLDSGATIENPVDIEYIHFFDGDDLVMVVWLDEEGFLQRSKSNVSNTRFIRKEDI